MKKSLVFGLVLSLILFASLLGSLGFVSAEGDLIVDSLNNIINNYTYFSGNESAGSIEIEVNNSSGFSVGQDIFILQTQNASGGQAGNYEFATIASINGNTIFLTGGLTKNYFSGSFNKIKASVTQIVSIPQYQHTIVNSGASLTSKNWDGYSGGILIFKSNTVEVNGTIDVSAKGFRGSSLVSMGYNYQGESYQGLGLNSYLNNLGAGGGGYQETCFDCWNPGGGGGGSYFTAGTFGGYWGAHPGKIYGESSLNKIYLGSAGGNGGRNVNNDNPSGTGGNGGGIIIIIAENISINGSINSKGGVGGSYYQCYIGVGGGGSGGSIFLAAKNIIGNNIVVNGGSGGGNNCGLWGGSGGLGIYYTAPEITGDTLYTTSRWEDVLGNPILEADLNDTVLMIAPGMYNGEDIVNYTVVKDGEPSWNPLNWLSHEVYRTSSLSIGLWKADTSGIFWFIARVLPSNSQKTSNNLNVSSVSNNTMPDAVITSLSEGYLTSVNYSINFIQASTDEDDDLNITWNLGDGRTKKYSNCQTNNTCNSVENYTSGGKWYILTLTASEMERSQSDTDLRNIYVFQQGINVVPVVTFPTDNYNLDALTIPFNASLSYVVNCSSAISGYNFTAGNLQCKYIHAPNTRTTNGSNLTVTWTITKENSPTETITGDWNTNYSQVVNFIKVFSTAGKRVIYLSISCTGGVCTA